MIKLRPLCVVQTAFTLCCVLGTLRGGAQSTDGIGDAVYRMHGSVVNGITGEPVAGALVMSADRRLAAMSDNEGSFSIDVRVPAKVQEAAAKFAAQRLPFARFAFRLFLNVQKPGFIQPGEPLSLALDDTLSSTNVKLKLMPAAMILGRISAAGADSVTNVRVTLFLHQVSGDGRRMWTQTSTTMATARGEFRFANLRPGEYSLMTAEWRGYPALPVRTGAVAQQMYPPIFYGDRPNLENAEKIHLHFGDSQQAELHLHATTYYPVTVPVTRPSEAAGVSVRVLDVSPFSGYTLRYDARAGAVEGSLPNGHYNLLLTSSGQRQGNEQPQQSYGLASINVEGAPVTTAPVAVAPAGTILVRLHTQFSGKSAASQGGGSDAPETIVSNLMDMAGEPSVQVTLQSEDGIGAYGSIRDPAGSPDELTLKNVPPGRYFVRTQSYRGYVSSMSSGVTDLTQQPLVIGDGSAAGPIDVTVRDDNPKLTGTVNLRGETISQLIYVLLLPMDGNGQFVDCVADLQGKFTVNNLAPGSYRVLAFRSRPRALAYRDPEFLRQLEGKGSTITAVAGETLQTQVDLLDNSVVEEN